MQVFDESSYKAAIRGKIKELRKTKPRCNLRWLAENVPVQYTYLSRVLNGNGAELSEAHLFKICTLLNLAQEEVEYLLLLRSAEATSDRAFRDYQMKKAERIREAKSQSMSLHEFNSSRLEAELGYFLDPYVVLIHMALLIPTVMKAPQLLCGTLGMTEDQLAEKLERLESMGFIKRGKKRVSVEKILKTRMHANTQHPLIRSHQQVLKNICNAQLLKINDLEKISSMATFTGSRAVFVEIRKEFDEFIRRVQKLTDPTPEEHVYQLSFDLFRWI